MNDTGKKGQRCLVIFVEIQKKKKNISKYFLDANRISPATSIDAGDQSRICLVICVKIQKKKKNYVRIHFGF